MLLIPSRKDSWAATNSPTDPIILFHLVLVDAISAAIKTSSFSCTVDVTSQTQATVQEALDSLHADGYDATIAGSTLTITWS